jgi:hypothetical protein
MLYTAQLLVPMLLCKVLQPRVTNLRGTAVVLFVYMMRVYWRLDKYLLWGIVICVYGTLLQYGVRLPALYICTMLAPCAYGLHRSSHWKAVDAVVDPNSRVLSNVHTGETHCRLRIRTRDKLEAFKPGQFVTLGNGTVTRKYTPISLASLDLARTTCITARLMISSWSMVPLASTTTMHPPQLSMPDVQACASHPERTRLFCCREEAVSPQCTALLKQCFRPGYLSCW